ncbi:MAG: hypothetical protein MJE77_22960 [Proteobacteria bacterium]|nr:hypothetical protein [Pseudomonadota bacterium]
MQLGGQGLRQARGIASTIGDLVGAGRPGRASRAAAAAGGKAGGLVKQGIQVAVKGGAGIGKLAGSLFGLARAAIPAVITGVRMIGTALMSNPIGLIIGGIALAAELIIKFWQPIKGFFTGLWDGVKSIFVTTWEWIKGSFLNVYPLGLLIKHWDAIAGFFGELWQGI